MRNVVDLARGGGADPRAVAALISISKKFRAILAIRLAGLGLRIGDDDVIVALRNGEIRSISDLSSSLKLRFEAINRLVDRLVGLGLIVWEVGPRVHLSEAGSALVSRIDIQKSYMARDLQRVLGTEELTRLTVELEALNVGLDSLIQQ